MSNMDIKFYVNRYKYYGFDVGFYLNKNEVIMPNAITYLVNAINYQFQSFHKTLIRFCTF